MGPKRSGQLVWRTTGWRARIRIEENGVTVRKLVKLDTTNKSVAKRKLNRLIGRVAKGVDVEDVDDEATRYSVQDFAEKYYDDRSKLVKSWKDEKRLYDACLAPTIGGSELGDVSAQDILDCLNTAAAERAHESVKKVRAQASALFQAARLAGLTTNNPLDGLKTPKPRRKKVPRAILSDAEFARYVAFPHAIGHVRPPGTVDLEVKVMGIVARTIGGQRGSDVHALEWAAVDTDKFETMLVRRPKTEHLSDETEEDVYVVPEIARPFLRAWWEAAGKPTKGPVFPTRRGKRAGEAKGKVSHAWALRRDLRRVFGLDVWDAKKGGYVTPAGREMTQREEEILEGTTRNRPVDFHSFRRAFATGLRHAKVDARDAMRLTHHTSYETHQRYVRDDGPIAAPPMAALPTLGPVLPVLEKPKTPPRLGTRRARLLGGRLENSNDFVGVRGFEPPTTCTQSDSEARNVAQPLTSGPEKPGPEEPITAEFRSTGHGSVPSGDNLHDWAQRFRTVGAMLCAAIVAGPVG